MRTILLLTLAQWASVCTTQGMSAEPVGAADTAAPRAQSAPPMRLTREDVDLVLRQARNAIQQGKLADADALVKRAESAHINYSVFHVGPTPETVRRELARAQQASSRQTGQAQGPSQQSAGMSRYLPFSRNTKARTSAPTDPFIGRDRTAKVNNQPNAPLPSALSSQSMTPGKSASLNEASAVRPATQTVAAASPAAPSRGESTLNPFSQASAAGGPNATAGAGQAASPTPPEVNPAVHTTPADKAAAALPNAPVPAGYTQARTGPNVPAGLVPPRRDSATSSTVKRSTNASQPKQQALAHLSAARKALDAGNVDLAEELSRAATSLNVPESQFLPNEDRPSLVAWDIVRARQADKSAPAALKLTSPAVGSRYTAEPSQSPAAATAPTVRTAQVNLPDNNKVAQAELRSTPEADIENQALAPAELPIPSNANDELQSATDDSPRATAAPMKSALAESTAKEEPPSQESTTTISDAGETAPSEVPAPKPLAPVPPAAPVASGPPAASSQSLIDDADESQQLLARQLSAEIGKRQTEAQKLREKDPERAVAILHEAQQLVNDSKLPESSRRELLSRINITLEKTQQFAKKNGAQIELDRQNEEVLADINRDREAKLKLQQKMADMVEEFNTLRDEQRYEEMEIIARRMYEMAPEDPLAKQIWQQAKFIRREVMNRQLADRKDSSNWEALNSVEESIVNPVAKDGDEMVFAKTWPELVKGRQGSRERVQRRSERELEIERRLKTPVLLKYQDTPLSEVADGLSELTGVNIHLDPRGLSQEGINTDTPITVNLAKEISLKSALNLILEPLHLSYVINDEVLKITSEQLRDGEVYAHTYNVADLVTPIPNFVPSNNIGLQGLINDSMASASSRGGLQLGPSQPTTLVGDRGPRGTDVTANNQVLAQQFNAAPTNGLSPSTVPIGAGPGGMGGGANADFDSLIDLIVSTVETDSWAENGGGQAEIRPFPTNLSLVISQTQAVHEEIADLLEQLRRLQDLQVTIEVRFIRLNESFFERIGVDFDMDINDNGVNDTSALTVANSGFEPFGPRSNTVGLQPPAGANVFPNFTADLDIPFRQDSFAISTPPFGGFDANSAARLGFAILSDIEAYFLIEAAQGDRRSNVLNAPKVTLFNGQQAFVADATQQPFVVGVIPVVGEFASAQQPVIVVLNEGTMMTIQAVVSDDRRYVRMTIVPFFTQIGDVDTFTFEGSSSSTSSSSATDDDDDGKDESSEESESETSSGVTVQLPSFSFVSVVTTVSVPDGGTVLLGGIKRLNEGRNEFGVPLLSKVPYVNRLFRNVGIGRTTESLMMMVTPRIIIQEEEEERLGIAVP
jgi:general secretion pathway protein D